jgi:AcrR family transcriptional regulator
VKRVAGARERVPSAVQIEHIYQVATEQFATKGYRGTSMRDIGEALG